MRRCSSKNINSLRDERSRLQNEQNEKWDEIKAFKDAYYQGLRDYREYAAKARKAREERYKKQRQEEELARRKKYAAEKLGMIPQSYPHPSLLTVSQRRPPALPLLPRSLPAKT